MTNELSLRDELRRLQRLDKPQRAGYEFEDLVAGLFRREHFSVERHARAAAPRQTDLFVKRSNDVYLVETKYRRTRATIDDVDSLFTRLDATPSDVIGILCSHAGFSKSVVKRVEERSSRPVLLISGNELDAVADGIESFPGMLRRKRASLLTHREVELDRVHHIPAKRRPPVNPLPASDEQFVLLDGRRTDVLASGGDFGPLIFTLDLIDIDWVPAGGVGVSADIDLDVENEHELIAVIHELTHLGWTTPKARWTIQQGTVNWHGSGTRSFADQLVSWRERYRPVKSLHHTEEFSYLDVCDGGLYTLTGSISASERRRVGHTNISFQLTGIPLDTSPLKHLCDTFDVRSPVYFRPKDERAIATVHSDGPPRKIVKPLAFVIKPADPNDPTEEDWVAGIVIKHPGYLRSPARRNTWLDGNVSGSEYLICHLRSWHPWGHPVKAYRLWHAQSTWTSDAQIVRPVADWDDKRTRHSHSRGPDAQTNRPQRSPGNRR
ncbi:hypothetical protein E0H73_40055 [Kribbella pittospori]|uniref:Restriction endonuclease type IV Mrr domain-containing protein n=1 Tax=Kribbella pittospori TaxID=722689 RepID=A0A4R0JX75_9ACTN|nr:restriction endonuclease [Kribbella pittospori]TCC52133.1 hypothetical protein E0H73_40055 [Kribbella pittospori]